MRLKITATADSNRVLNGGPGPPAEREISSPAVVRGAGLRKFSAVARPRSADAAVVSTSGDNRVGFLQARPVAGLAEPRH